MNRSHMLCFDADILQTSLRKFRPFHIDVQLVLHRLLPRALIEHSIAILLVTSRFIFCH